MYAMDGIFVRCDLGLKSRNLPHYIFSQNDPFDRSTPIRLVVPQIIESKEFMRSIREFKVPQNAFAVWFLGQNGFILKAASAPLIGIDLYLSNSCASTSHQPAFRVDRQLPVFIDPQDLDIDIFITTHSHADHADPETIRRVRKNGATRFVGPFDSMRVFQECGVPTSLCQLIHPGETLELGGSVVLQATFALPTDDTDLNHTGMLVRFANGLTFYSTGDTAYAERLSALLPTDVDVCAICINGGYHNLTVPEAAEIVKLIRPRVVVPCHYDMMVNNVGSPEMLRVALNLAGSSAHFAQMTYYEPWLYQRG
jgi:L-ascorbate 6-phosphate lactonase